MLLVKFSPVEVALSFIYSCYFAGEPEPVVEVYIHMNALEQSVFGLNKVCIQWLGIMPNLF
jgi:hypothetical protein